MDDITHPHNVNNVLITKEDIKTLFKKYDIEIDINNIDLFIKALTHKSYIVSDNMVLNQVNNNSINLMKDSSERIEFFGDTVVKCIVAKYLYTRYYNESEGFLTRLKAKIENRKTLAKFARLLGIDNYLIISKHNEEIFNRNSDKFLEDAYEGFIGALLFDQGFDFCEKYLNILLETEIDYANLLYIDTNFKDKIQRYYHQNSWGHPVFEDISSKTIANKIYFTVALKDYNNKEIVRAEELTKKKAEQKASMFALLKYRIIHEDQIVDDFD